MDRTSIFSRTEYTIALVLTLSCTLVFFFFFSNMMARSRDVVRDSYLQFLNITIVTELSKAGQAPTVQQLSDTLLAVGKVSEAYNINTDKRCLSTAHSGGRDTCAFYYQTCDNRGGYILGAQYESKAKQANYDEGGHYDNLYEIGKCDNPNASLTTITLPDTPNSRNTKALANVLTEEN